MHADDRTQQSESDSVPKKRTKARPPKSKAERRRFSRLTGLILAINLLALALVAIGSLVLDRYRNQLVAAELRAMTLQAEVLAQTLGESVVDEANGTVSAMTPDLVRPIVRRFSAPVKTRIRVFDTGGVVVADSRVLRGPGGVVQVSPLPPPDAAEQSGADQTADNHIQQEHRYA